MTKTKPGMRAIIIATGHSGNINPDYDAGVNALGERYPSPLRPLMDRPFIQHVVEFLVGQGVVRFDFVLSHLPEKIERLLGDGSRWGSSFYFHLARDPIHPYSLLRSINLEGSETLLIGHADRLPGVSFADLKGPTSFYVSDSENKKDEWSGWAFIPTLKFVNLLMDLQESTDEKKFEGILNSHTDQNVSMVKVNNLLSVKSFSDLLAAHKKVLCGNFTGLMLDARETEKGVWLSRNVSIHPMAKLIPPVYIGQNCRIEMGARLGPNMVAGNNCVLDTRCSARESVIFSGSYVGEELELNRVLVDRNCLVNLDVGTELTVVDDFIIGSMPENHVIQWLTGFFSRTMAIIILVFIWPVLLFTVLWLKIFRSGPVVYKKEVVLLPASNAEFQRKTYRLYSFCPYYSDSNESDKVFVTGYRELFFHFFPALINIAQGKLRFVGVSPRTKQEIKTLSSDWKTLYLRAKAGIISEAFVNYGANSSEDDIYSAEVFYSVASGVRHDFKLFIKYFSRLFA